MHQQIPLGITLNNPEKNLEFDPLQNHYCLFHKTQTFIEKTHHILVQNPILHKKKIPFTWTVAQGKEKKALKSYSKEDLSVRPM